MNWFYDDADGRKRGPVNDAQLRQLAAQGTIVPETRVEDENGTRCNAGQVPDLLAERPQYAGPSSGTNQSDPVSKPATVYYYYDRSGVRHGPVRGSAILSLAREGKVFPETPVEDSKGRKFSAKIIKRISFAVRPLMVETGPAVPQKGSPVPTTDPLSKQADNPFVLPAPSVLPPKGPSTPIPPFRSDGPFSVPNTGPTFSNALEPGNKPESRENITHNNSIRWLMILCIPCVVAVVSLLVVNHFLKLKFYADNADWASSSALDAIWASGSQIFIGPLSIAVPLIVAVVTFVILLVALKRNPD